MAGGPGLCKAKALRKPCHQAEGTRARREACRLGAGRWGGYFLSCAASARAALESVPTGAEQSPAVDKPSPHDSPSPPRCSLRERLTVKSVDIITKSLHRLRGQHMRSRLLHPNLSSVPGQSHQHTQITLKYSSSRSRICILAKYFLLKSFFRGLPGPES